MWLLPLLVSGTAALLIPSRSSGFSLSVSCLYPATSSSRSRTCLSMTGSRKKEIYDVPNSGWSSPDWNWGYGVGTGHDCALICRDRYATKASRAELIDSLMQGASSNNNIQFEEVKLILALAWQRGRWDGSDGGPDGYGHVLAAMASAERYEVGTEQACSMRFVQDIRDRFHLLNPTDEDREAMEALSTSMVTNVDGARLRCAGLVLKAMRFVEGGL